MNTVRTTAKPWKTIEVTDAEVQNLHRLGFLLEDSFDEDEVEHHDLSTNTSETDSVEAIPAEDDEKEA